MNFDSRSQATILPPGRSAVEPRHPIDVGGNKNAAMTVKPWADKTQKQKQRAPDQNLL